MTYCVYANGREVGNGLSKKEAFQVATDYEMRGFKVETEEE